jgi:NADP-dependent 3-hydroxy acid dehydrogenase YdfG
MQQKKTIVVCGHGPGISDAVARRFGRGGFQLALVSRSKAKLDAAAERFQANDVTAKGFVCDLGDAAAVKALFAEVQKSLGPVTVMHWNASHGSAGDLLSCSADDLRAAFNVSVTGLVAAVQAAVPQMTGQLTAAVLVTGGGFSQYDNDVDKMIVDLNVMGLAIAKSAQHKTTRLLHRKLIGRGIFVGEVTVLGTVKGTAFDRGQATLHPETVAAAFWKLYTDRDATSVTCR